jgi:hypothetical protein
MPNLRNHFRSRIFSAAFLLAGLLVMVTPDAGAWGYQGHAQVGRIALSLVDEKAGLYLQGILGTDVLPASDEACSWPDVVRETPEWEWSAPQHYVNMPRASSEYERERDCPTGLCVTESIKKYADQLSDPRLGQEQHWQAYAWLCHLVGDVHQPLHTGYKDDRGANYVKISFNGEEGDLHQFWDRLLIQDRIGKSGEWPQTAPGDLTGRLSTTWNPVEADEWTTESHRLVKTVAYPEDTNIQPEFADRSWLIIQDQVQTAGYRLGRILNATIGEGEVRLESEIPRDSKSDAGVAPIGQR